MARETELSSIETAIKKYLRANASDADLQKAVAALGRLRDEYEVLPKDEVAKLQQEAQKLKEAPLQYAIYLGPGPTHQRDILVGVGQSIFEAHIADELADQPLSLGQQVLLNNEHNVVGIRSEYVRGETAEVINILRPPNSGEIISLLDDQVPLRALVKWTDGEETEVKCADELASAKLARGDIVQIDPETMIALAKVRPRLHVRAGGTDGTVVEISDRLFNEGVRLGDLVRVESGLKFAFEKLPSLETRELTLEEVPDISYADIGGLDAQIETFRDAIELPYLQRSKFQKYRLSRPKGILLYGPPGCGKTMVAKAVANSLTESIRAHLSSLEQRIKLYISLKANPKDAETLAAVRALLGIDADSHDSSAQPAGLLTRLEGGLRIHDVDLKQPEEKLREIRSLIGREEVRSYFLNVKGPELLDKYVGETEHRIRSIFEEARRHASYYTPVVIFFDEMEAMFRARGTGRSSDVETTIVPQFLSEIDGFESSANVILIGATNRDDMIDPAILRPGRLDVKIKIDRPTKEAAADIFSFYLLPTLPLSRSTAVAANKTVGSIVFRTAYHKTTEADEFDGELLPPNFDLRLALSFSPEERARLAEFSQNLNVAQVLTHKQQDAGSPTLLVKLRLLKGATRVEEITPKLEGLNRSYVSNSDLRSRVDYLVQMEWIAEAMIHDAISLLYSPTSSLKVLAKSGNHYTFMLSDFVTGAVIANIVSRTKKRAIKRELISIDGYSEGITFEDLRAAIEEEFTESREQLALYKLRDEMNLVNELIQSVDLQLESGRADPWSEDKPKAYKIA
ncbi:MAG TPA: AAA family ATPase [Pyrinomonadaceae bacterium]|nr:AAA family ATPase [Pyrinomonadaceae bacterium]